MCAGAATTAPNMLIIDIADLRTYVNINTKCSAHIRETMNGRAHRTHRSSTGAHSTIIHENFVCSRHARGSRWSMWIGKECLLQHTEMVCVVPGALVNGYGGSVLFCMGCSKWIGHLVTILLWSQQRVRSALHCLWQQASKKKRRNEKKIQQQQNETGRISYNRIAGAGLARSFFLRSCSFRFGFLLLDFVSMGFRLHIIIFFCMLFLGRNTIMLFDTGVKMIWYCSRRLLFFPLLRVFFSFGCAAHVWMVAAVQRDLR